MFPGLSIFRKHGWATLFLSLSTFGKHDLEPNISFPSFVTFEYDSKFLIQITKNSSNSPETFKKSLKDSKKDKTTAKARPKEDKTTHSVDDWGSEDWAPLEDSTPVASSPSSTSVGTSGTSATVGDNWDTDGWDNFDSFEDDKQSSADIARKKREERRRQREQALKEKRAAKAGSKLGAVKKA